MGEQGPYPDSSPLGVVKRTVANSYRRWCLVCKQMQETKGGKIRNKRFHCRGCV